MSRCSGYECNAGVKQTAVIGAGAAGCLCAIQIRRSLPNLAVTVYEAGPKPLAKVAVTGGGRCNFTNTFDGIKSLGQVYPRGVVLMKRVFRTFDNHAVMHWFETEGVSYVIQEDGCVFPESQDAMQVVRTLAGIMRKEGVQLRCNCPVASVETVDGGFRLDVPGGPVFADRVVVTTGGGALKLLEPLGLAIEKPVPSLFSFRIADKSLCSLMGTVAPAASVLLAGTSYRGEGPLLVTDWGLSGPAILRLSSYAARHLADAGYRGRVLVNWCGLSEVGIRQFLSDAVCANARKQVGNVPPDGLNARLFRYLVARSGLRPNILWSELGSKGINRLVSTLTADGYELAGRCRFKTEFVTCGGVSLSEINLSTLESRRYPGLYFAGEVLDVDAVTGGFNLQAAWSTAMAVARSMPDL